MSKAALLEKLTDKTYRDAFVSDEIDIGLPMQLRAMREARGWKQKEVAEKTETKQSRFSLMEKPGYGRFSLNTLKKIASVFDVGLIVSFVPYSEMIDFVNSLGPKRLSIPSFASEYVPMVRRYNRGSREFVSTGQGTLDFTISTSKPDGAYDGNSTATREVVSAFGTFPKAEEIIYWIPPVVEVMHAGTR